jgi:hypothetical protein
MQLIEESFRSDEILSNIIKFCLLKPNNVVLEKNMQMDVIDRKIIGQQ